MTGRRGGRAWRSLAEMLRDQVPELVEQRKDETVWGPHATTTVLADKARMVDLITSRSDRMQFVGDPEVSAALVWSVASLVLHSRGGVTVFGEHFCDPHGGPCVNPECGADR